MANNKYDFIKELLANKSLSHEKRERILDLASKEMNLGGTLEDRIQKLEDLIVGEATQVVDVPDYAFSDELYDKIVRSAKSKVSERKNISLPKYINPSNQYRALLAYNQNSILKPTCHPMSGDNVEDAINYLSTDVYNYLDHLKIIKLEFEKLAKEERFTTKMYSLINNYINGNGKWSNENISDSWSSNQLLSWASEFPAIAPNPDDTLAETYRNEGYKLEKPFVSNLTNRSIVTFRDLTIHFKSLWHIKDGNSLKPILTKRNIDYNFKDWCDISFDNFSETMNLYTDVDKLVQTYSKLIELIRENSGAYRQSVVVSFYEENDYKILSLHQQNTFWKKTIKDTIEKPFGNSMRPIIDKQINGLCNLHVKARFESGKCSKINLWDGKKREAEREPVEDFNGVQYLLIFTR